MQNETKVHVATPVHYDQALQITTCSLLALGMAMIFISSTLMAQSQYNDAYYFIKRQGVYALLGLGALFLGRTSTTTTTSAGSTTSSCSPSLPWSWSLSRASAARSGARPAGCAWVP